MITANTKHGQLGKYFLLRSEIIQYFQ